MDFSEAGPQTLGDVPALEHQLVQVAVAVPGAGEGGRRLAAEAGQQLRVAEVVVRPQPREVEDLPQADAEWPHVRLGGVAVLEH